MLNINEAMRTRHSVRKYTDRPIEQEIVDALNREISSINNESGLKFTLFTNEPETFKANKPSYGSFSGCRNYIALVGKKNDDEKIGYYGEKLVIYAARLGLNTCWVAMTFEKSKVNVQPGSDEKLHDVIAIGYGVNQGVQHKNKDISKLADIDSDTPKWFLDGMDAVMLAPTAMNQQRFKFSLSNGKVKAKALIGPYSKTDLGIVKYHFEIGAGIENFEWAD